MDARNTFSVLGLLDGDATVGALRFALRGAHPSALRLPSSPFGAASSARGHPSARVGAASSASIGLPAAHVGASSSAAIGLPAALGGASSSAAIGLPAALVGASSSAFGLHSANGGASSSSIPVKADAPEIEDLIFDDPSDPSLLLDPVDSDPEDLVFDDPSDPSLKLDPVDSDAEGGFVKVKPTKFRMVRGIGPDEFVAMPPQEEDEETAPRYARARGRLCDVSKWIRITETSRGELDRGWNSHHI